jgi:hypothetical protein
MVMVCIAVSGLMAAENPAVAQIHEKIKVLEVDIKVLEKDKEATLKRVLGWYNAVIKRGVLTEDILIVERKELKLQEDELLLAAPNEATRTAIHQHYDGIRALLRVDTKIDDIIVDKLEILKTAHRLQIDGAYNSKIEGLRIEVEALKIKAKQLSEIKPPKK